MVEIVTGVEEVLVVVVVLAVLAKVQDVVVHSPVRTPVPDLQGQEVVLRVILFDPVVHVPDPSVARGPQGPDLVRLSTARLLPEQGVALGPLGPCPIPLVQSPVVVAGRPLVLGVGIGMTLGTVGPGLRVRINRCFNQTKKIQFLSIRSSPRSGLLRIVCCILLNHQGQ